MLPDLAQSCQSAKKVLPDVAKCRQRGSKGFQRVPRGSKGKWYQMWQKNAKGVPRESATRCGKKSPKGFQKLSKVVQLYLLRRTGSNACLRCWPEGPAPQAHRRRLAQGPKGPELVYYILTGFSRYFYVVCSVQDVQKKIRGFNN